jgi:glycine cleavage system T protein (aminomethyltransferase)
LTTPAQVALKRTALHSLHKSAGARMVEFGGWEMPVEYSGITAEHLAVRKAAGLFDVSHMGEIEVCGPGATDLLQFVTSNDVSRLADGQAQYSALMLENGACVDDCVVHRRAANDYFLCVNASNTDRDFEWITEHNRFGAEVRNASDEYAQLAIQGPRASAIVARLTPQGEAGLAALRYYWFQPARCAGVEGMLARTGYTGEDGLEFYFPPQHAARVWEALLDAGRGDGLVPCGLGARNTLRLEAGYALYGHELDDATTLLEANLGWIAKLDKGEFLGGEALRAQKQHGLTKKLVGFEMLERGIARDGYPVVAAAGTVGRVTSGSPAPFLKKNIGLAYLPPGDAAVGREIGIEVRGKTLRARQAALPFYKRPK